MIDRELLRVRLVDILATFAPRAIWEDDRRTDYWTSRLMEAERPGPGEPAEQLAEVQALRRRVAELEVAAALLDDAEQDAEREVEQVERVLRERLQRDAHVVAVERERDDLRRKVEAIRSVAGSARAHGTGVTPLDLEGILDTPSTKVVDDG